MGRVKLFYGQQTELAKKAGISNRRLNDFISGRRRPSWDTAKRLAEASAQMGLGHLTAPFWMDIRKESK